MLQQASMPMQIIIVDDGSDCDYQDIISKVDFAQLDYLRLPKRMGANVARNHGVNKANGDVITFLDDDDAWFPNFIENHLKIYAENPTTSAVVCGSQIMGSKVQKINNDYFVSEASLRRGNNFCGMSGVSAKREVLLEYPFDVALQNGQDWDLLVRLVSNHKIIRNISKPLFQYRKNTPNSISTLTKKLRIEKSDARLASVYKHKQWLGEYYFKRRAADQLLAFILQKPDRFKWLAKCVKLSGYRITFSILMKKLTRTNT